jgi:hypothetical protein
MIARPLLLLTFAAALLAVLALAERPAAAESKVIVLTFSGAEGAKVQSAVSAALLGAGLDVAPGDTSFDDAAILIGCDGKSEACADEVLATLSVDEIVYGGTARNGDITLTRVARGKPRRQARARVEAGQSLDAAISPAVRELFDQVEPTAEPEPPPPPPLARPEPLAAPRSASGERPYRTWAVVSWSGAGVAAVAGLLLWVKAGSLQDDIDRAPDGNQQEIDDLRDLESRADTASTWGNVMVVSAAVLAGTGTYLWIKGGRTQRGDKATRTSLAPAVFPGGAGVMLTIGGLR